MGPHSRNRPKNDRFRDAARKEAPPSWYAHDVKDTLPAGPLQRMRQAVEGLKKQNRAHNLDAIAAGCLSLVGAVLVFLSFQATSATMSVVAGEQWDVRSPAQASAYEPFVALCVGDKNVIQKFQDRGDPLVGGACPDGARHPIAEVTKESGNLVRWGWLMTVVGAIWQMFIASRSRLALK